MSELSIVTDRQPPDSFPDRVDELEISYNDGLGPIIRITPNSHKDVLEIWKKIQDE